MPDGRILLVQPPFVQLNAPYPSCAYLKMFLSSLGRDSRAYDLSIATFRAVFSSNGLARVFAAAEGKKAEYLSSRDKAVRDNMIRYFSAASSWIGSIDGLVSYLSGSDPGYSRKVLSLGFPSGHRVESWLDAAGREPLPGDELVLATLALEDIADFVSFAYDSGFSLGRYAESLAASAREFGPVRDAAESSPVLNEFLVPLINTIADESRDSRLACVTVPFPGCLPGALAAARGLKRAIPGIRVAFGGGYVSTELRHLKDPGIFDYCDYLCYDSGFGALRSILDLEPGESPRGRLFGTLVRDEEGRVHALGMGKRDASFFATQPGTAASPCDKADRYRSLEAADRVSVFPDYSDFDFAPYLRIRESSNPMHALWSDVKWLKAYAAAGCYWGKCSFCDGTLQYVSGYARTDIRALYASLLEEARARGVMGVHLTDEAAPPAALADFALENILHGNPLVFWGNARFEKSFDRELCELLYAGGFMAVSAGIEAAGGKGLSAANKGLSLRTIVNALSSFKSAGILTHGYLMYGLPGQDEADIADSAEIVRQMFLAGLLDSAFWHRFTLTRHSLMYGEFLDGSRSGLRPVVPDWEFALNDLSFEGAEAYRKFDGPLDRALASWMAGHDLEKPVSAWLGNRAAPTSVPPGFVASLLDSGGISFPADADKGRKAVWLGGAFQEVADAKGRVKVFWSYRNRVRSLRADAEAWKGVSRFISGAKGRRRDLPPMDDLMGSCPGETGTALRQGGLVLL